ncbi:replication factor A protein 2 [Varicellaria rhodocarpa]|nr:replication factor A protein 2 [Varicellaria rhodocarpa]
MDYSNHGNAQYGNGQYSTTSYGAQGGGGGGGFMGGSQSGSQQSPAGKGAYGKDTLRPVTIRQVLNAYQPHPDAEFKIDDIEITQVTFVGQIRNISTQTTNITYKMDDGTGTVEVKQWIDTDNDAPTKTKLETDGWARVWGRLKAFNNKRHVGAHVIRPLTDMNEINAHLLEATFVHLYFTRGPPEQFSTGGTDGGGAQQQQDQYAQNGYQDAGGQSNGRLLPHMGNAAKRVYEALITSPQSNEGLHIQNVALLLGIPIAEVMKAGDELLSSGLIYTTVDDNTWAVMDAS